MQFPAKHVRAIACAVLLLGSADYSLAQPASNDIVIGEQLTISSRMLVVAIPNTSRARDLTPASTTPPDGEQEQETGGATNFRAFIASELMAWISGKPREVGFSHTRIHSHLLYAARCPSKPLTPMTSIFMPS